MIVECLASQVRALVAALDSLFQWFVGTPDRRSTYAVTRCVFLRALGAARAARWPGSTSMEKGTAT
jgi:hypothetical protein